MQKSPQRECEHEKKNAVNMHGKGNIGKVIKNKKQKMIAQQVKQVCERPTDRLAREC